MFLHIGEDYMLLNENIVAIFDFDMTTISETTQEFLRKREREGTLMAISEELPKSFIIADQGGEEIIFLSPLSTLTLMKRAI